MKIIGYRNTTKYQGCGSGYGKDQYLLFPGSKFEIIYFLSGSSRPHHKIKEKYHYFNNIITIMNPGVPPNQSRTFLIAQKEIKKNTNIGSSVADQNDFFQFRIRLNGQDPTERTRSGSLLKT